jgi:hypothetical protein
MHLKMPRISGIECGTRILPLISGRFGTKWRTAHNHSLGPTAKAPQISYLERREKRTVSQDLENGSLSLKESTSGGTSSTLLEDIAPI